MKEMINRSLFSAVYELRQNVVRNIVNILSAKEAFSDLLSNPKDSFVAAEKAMTRVMKQSDKSDSFHYLASIGYPFETDNFMASRYSDGTFPIWYGSMNSKTAIYETAHHAIKDIMSIANIEKYPSIIRERVVYDIFCQGILIDLTIKKQIQSKLVANTYGYTQKIGKQLNQQGYPGLLAPSARLRGGINVNIFKQEILSNPLLKSILTYEILPADKKIKVYQRDRLLHEIHYQEHAVTLR